MKYNPVVNTHDFLAVNFWISEPYDRQKVHDDLIPKLQNACLGSQIQKGKNKSVIKFVYNGLKIDLVLSPKKEFRKRVNKDRLEVL